MCMCYVMELLMYIYIYICVLYCIVTPGCFSILLIVFMLWFTYCHAADEDSKEVLQKCLAELPPNIQ